MLSRGKFLSLVLMLCGYAVSVQASGSVIRLTSEVSGLARSVSEAWTASPGLISVAELRQNPLIHLNRSGVWEDLETLELSSAGMTIDERAFFLSRVPHSVLVEMGEKLGLNVKNQAVAARLLNETERFDLIEDPKEISSRLKFAEDDRVMMSIIHATVARIEFALSTVEGPAGIRMNRWVPEDVQGEIGEAATVLTEHLFQFLNRSEQIRGREGLTFSAKGSLNQADLVRQATDLDLRIVRIRYALADQEKIDHLVSEVKSLEVPQVSPANEDIPLPSRRGRIRDIPRRIRGWLNQKMGKNLERDDSHSIIQFEKLRGEGGGVLELSSGEKVVTGIDDRGNFLFSNPSSQADVTTQTDGWRAFRRNRWDRPIMKNYSKEAVPYFDLLAGREPLSIREDGLNVIMEFSDGKPMVIVRSESMPNEPGVVKPGAYFYGERLEEGKIFFDQNEQTPKQVFVFPKDLEIDEAFHEIALTERSLINIRFTNGSKLMINLGSFQKWNIRLMGDD